VVITRVEFSFFAILLSGYGLWLVGMFATAMIRSRARHRRRIAAATVEPAIHEALIQYLAGNSDLTPFREAAQNHRESLEKEILSFETTAAGAALEILCDLALQVGLVRDWCEETSSRDLRRRRAAFAHLAFANIFEPCRRRIGNIPERALEDGDRHVRLSAGRALARSGEPPDTMRAFEWTLSQGLLERMVVAPELRPHAIELSEQAIPDALRAADPARIRAALEILIAWERAIPSVSLWAAVRTLFGGPDTWIADTARRVLVLVSGGAA
jgi:hypothetical protein